jgi:hypothetical protein
VTNNSPINKRQSANDLFQVILSNGFPRLRICIAVGIGSLNSSETWTQSPSLRHLVLDPQVSHVCEQILAVCPNLRPLKRSLHSQTDSPISMLFVPKNDF